MLQTGGGCNYCCVWGVKLKLKKKNHLTNSVKYWGADKSLTRLGRKQARKHVRRRAQFQQHRDASCHQVSFPARQGSEGNSHLSDRNISLFSSWSG